VPSFALSEIPVHADTMQVAATATKQVNELTIFIFVSSFPFKTFAIGKHFEPKLPDVLPA
jgi:hypothetical protein